MVLVNKEVKIFVELFLYNSKSEPDTRKNSKRSVRTANQIA